jgi:hypothetical protein
MVAVVIVHVNQNKRNLLPKAQVGRAGLCWCGIASQPFRQGGPKERVSVSTQKKRSMKWGITPMKGVMDGG